MVSVLESNITWCHAYDWVYKPKPQQDLKSLSIVPLIQDTKTKTHTDFSYTIKALRSKKKFGYCFRDKYDLMSWVWLSIKSRTATGLISSIDGLAEVRMYLKGEEKWNSSANLINIPQQGSKVQC